MALQLASEILMCLMVRPLGMGHHIDTFIVIVSDSQKSLKSFLFFLVCLEAIPTMLQCYLAVLSDHSW